MTDLAIAPPTAEPVGGEVPMNVREARRHNNYGALRLLFSLGVLYSHCYPLATGQDGDLLAVLSGARISCGYVAVDGFFLISGCLITQSWVRSRSAENFSLRRILRIYPGFFAALVFSACVGVVGSGAHSLEYLRNLYYNNDSVLRSALLLDSSWVHQQPTFPDNPYHAVNGSMWTLPYELMCYAAVLVLGVFGFVGRQRGTAVVTALLFAIYLVNATHLTGISQKSCRFLCMFGLGACVSAGVFGAIRLTPLGVALALGVLVAASQVKYGFALAYPPVFVYLLFGVAYCDFNPGAAALAHTDLSYGIYLYAFPVQQLVVLYRGAGDPLGVLAWSLPATLLLAYLSWVLVEKPCIAWSNRLTARVT